MDNFGQLFITGIKGISLTKDEVEFIKNEKIGGIILSSENFQDPGQLAELVNSIQKLRDEYPLFISVDQSGSRGKSFQKHFTQFPTLHEIATLDSPKVVFEVHQVMARELSACGINLIYSPSCDILTNPDNQSVRDYAYGQDAETVEKFISAAIRGLQTSGILACAKHFPGVGATTQDPQFTLPLVKTSIEEIRSRELIPFIKASKSRVEFMMMGHVLADAIDEKLPTSLSTKAYELLRQETKFSKIVITDDLELKAISDRYSPEIAVSMALTAGADMVIYRHLENAAKALAAIREGVKKKTIKRESIVEKVLRVEKCKREHFAEYNPIYIPKIAESFHSSESKKLVEHLKNSLTVRV